MDADGCSLTCPLSRLAPTRPVGKGRASSYTRENCLLMGASIEQGLRRSRLFRHTRIWGDSDRQVR